MHNVAAGSNEAIMEPEAAHDFGNNLRSKHRSRAGDFVLFSDDDNFYAPDALSVIRTVVYHDTDALCEGPLLLHMPQP